MKNDGFQEPRASYFDTSSLSFSGLRSTATFSRFLSILRSPKASIWSSAVTSKGRQAQSNWRHSRAVISKAHFDIFQHFSGFRPRFQRRTYLLIYISLLVPHSYPLTGRFTGHGLVPGRVVGRLGVWTAWTLRVASCRRFFFWKATTLYKKTIKK